MFPHPCGDQFEQAVQLYGVSPTGVVPDDYVVVRGGNSPMPATGTLFSGAAGPTLLAAACAVPHGQLRATTAGAIRAAGGTVVWQPGLARSGTINKQHVHVTELGRPRSPRTRAVTRCPWRSGWREFRRLT